MPFSPEASDALLEGLPTLPGKRRHLDDEMLRAAAPLFTGAWLFDVLPKALGRTQPFIHNSDGEEIVFHEVRFPLEVGLTQKDIAARLDGIQHLRQERSILELAGARRRTRAEGSSSAECHRRGA